MLNEHEHEELNQAVKDVVYFVTKRTLNDQERKWVDWLKKQLDLIPR